MLRRMLYRWFFDDADYRIHARFNDLHHEFNIINQRISIIMANLDDLLANARAMDTRLDSIRALITDLRAALDEALSSAKLPKATQDKIDELFGVMQNNLGEVNQALQPPGTILPPEEVPQPAPAEPTPVADTPKAE